MNFESTTVQSTFLDPQNEFERRAIDVEHRRDPLTGRFARIAHYIPPRERAAVPQAVLDAAIPIFAPPLVQEITPRFPDELVAGGRLVRGRSVLFPNLNPYDEYSPVVAVGDRPYVAPGDLDPDDIGDALCLLREFFSALPEDRRVGMIGWNFLPQSSSSIPHPHMQAVATYRPPERAAEEYAAESHHRDETGRAFWSDFLAAERDGPRWLGDESGWNAVVAFAPRSPIPETWIVSDEIPHLLGATDADLHTLATMIAAVAGAYDQLGYASFNVLIHPTAPAGPDSRMRVRYVPRAHIVPKLASSDWSWVHIGTEEGLCMTLPEEFAQRLREVMGR